VSLARAKAMFASSQQIVNGAPTIRMNNIEDWLWMGAINENGANN